MHGTRSRTGLKRYLADLRRSFSELRFDVHENVGVLVEGDLAPRRLLPAATREAPAHAQRGDDVWGKRTYDETTLFEALALGVFQAGLSWSVVFGKRDAFRSAFHGFDVAKVAAMTERDVDRLVQDPAIIRNRAKILPTSTPEADALAKQLKSQGFRFVGPTSVYAFMQNVGVVNHVHGCIRATD